MDVEPIDLGHELRQRVQRCLDLPPVIIGLPVADELLELRELHALGLIGDSLPVGPSGCRQAPAAARDAALPVEYWDALLKDRRAYQVRASFFGKCPSERKEPLCEIAT
jgi:hypothetical protein